MILNTVYSIPCIISHILDIPYTVLYTIYYVPHTNYVPFIFYTTYESGLSGDLLPRS